MLVMFIKLVGSSLFCMGANKGLHDFSMNKVVILIFFLLERCSSLVTGLLTLYAVDHKNKFMVLLFLFVRVAHS